MHHAVTHGVNLFEVFDDSYFGVGEQAEDELHALCVLGNVVHYLLLIAVGELHFHESVVESYALGAARCHH